MAGIAGLVNQIAIVLCLVFVAFVIRGARERLDGAKSLHEHAR